jgi:hypothetical protein
LNAGPGFSPIAIKSSPVASGGGFNTSGGVSRISRSQYSTCPVSPPPAPAMARCSANSSSTPG